jgi:outer membrane lipase/esterase
MRNLALLAFSLTLFAWRISGAQELDLHKFHSLVVFGDSLSDNGNSLALSHGTTPDPRFYYMGRWTNGPNWVDYFAPLIGLSVPTAYLSPQGGTNFATGAATSKDLAAQIDAFLARTGGHAPADALYCIWIGSLDLLALGAAISPDVTVDDIRNGIVALATAGAKAFVVMELPDVSLTPLVQSSNNAATIQAAKQFVYTVNAGLLAAVPLTAWLHGIAVDLVHINVLFNELVYLPQAFDFTNTKDPAFNATTGQVVPDPDDYLFWDDLHPTTRAHFFGARFIYETITSKYGLPGIGSLAVALP